jgi:hypothetical protein
MDVQIEHRLNTLPWSGGEVAMVAKARIVHEEIDMDFLCGKPFHEGEAAVVAREICDKEQDGHFVYFEEKKEASI